MLFYYLAVSAAPLLVLVKCTKKSQRPSSTNVLSESAIATNAEAVKTKADAEGVTSKPLGEVDAKSKSNKDKEKEKEKEKEPVKEEKKEEKKDMKDSKEVGEDNRAKWANRVIQLKCKAISQEFTDKVKKYAAPNHTNKAHNDNPIKNRYTDVLCLDSTRVILKGRGKEDYIHGSWVTVPDSSTKYICTQGPLPETLVDFWHMVFQEKTKFVIMLCNLVEGGADKCTLYWPEKKGTSCTYGAYKVQCVEIRPDPVEGVRWSILDITYKGEVLQVYHVLVSWWPDQLAPADPAPMVALYKWVKKLNEKTTPILVHCSAGVGRTATFVGIDYANIRIKDNSEVNLMDVIKDMRNQRYQSIQSHLQYLYLHIVLLEYFIQEGYVPRDNRMVEFMEEYQRHAERKLAKRKNEEKDKDD